MNYTYDVFGNEHKVLLEQVRVEGQLLHATPKDNKESILKNGLLLGQPQCKSLANTNALFLSEVVHSTTGDLFRWYDNWCIVVVDLNKIPNVKFFRDFFAAPEMERHGHRNNHVMCLESIPPEAIYKIVEF